MVSLGCDVQKRLTSNYVLKHHWNVIYVIMDYMSYFLALRFPLFKSDFE